jgi:putative membrane protein
MLFLVLLINALALLITERLVEGIYVADFKTAVFIALILGIVNTFIRHFLTALSAPLNIYAITVFTFIINAIVLYVISLTVEGFLIRGAASAILCSIVLSIISSLLIHLLIKLQNNKKVKKTKKRKK